MEDFDTPEEPVETPLEEGPEEAMEPTEGPTDEFDMEADAVFNTALPIAERRTALKNAIMACMGTDYGAKEEPEGGGDMFSSLLGEG